LFSSFDHNIVSLGLNYALRSSSFELIRAVLPSAHFKLLQKFMYYWLSSFKILKRLVYRLSLPDKLD
jgi:hypothetical protein